VPATLAEMAERLQSRPSVTAAFRGLPKPAVQLIEAIQSSGGPAVAHDELAAAVGRTPDDPDLAAIVRVLSLRALVWPDGPWLRMAGPLWSAFAHPLHLGPPADRLFTARTTESCAGSRPRFAPPVPDQQQLVDGCGGLGMVHGCAAMAAARRSRRMPGGHR
jgi:hypothetical protein